MVRIYGHLKVGPFCKFHVAIRWGVSLGGFPAARADEPIQERDRVNRLQSKTARLPGFVGFMTIS